SDLVLCHASRNSRPPGPAQLSCQCQLSADYPAPAPGRVGLTTITRNCQRCFALDQSGRRDLNATASVRGRCFYWHLGASKDRITNNRQQWTGKHYGKHLQRVWMLPSDQSG